jgi:hypothetical protein
MSETSTIVTPLVKALNELPGCWAMRVNAGRRGGVALAPKGTPDVHATVRGWSLWFEAKKPGQKAKPEQEATHTALRAAGAFVFVVESHRAGLDVAREFLRRGMRES